MERSGACRVNGCRWLVFFSFFQKGVVDTHPDSAGHDTNPQYEIQPPQFPITLGENDAVPISFYLFLGTQFGSRAAGTVEKLSRAKEGVGDPSKSGNNHEQWQPSKMGSIHK
jgi:hypothetical protein